ncbi:unnamed protein product [Linum trigynum]|uniref:Uncharacterized protein n=1 Tax=Linum trigynum TaxID=586398 RepID=A0AAV2FCM4_9ROSI
MKGEAPLFIYFKVSAKFTVELGKIAGAIWEVEIAILSFIILHFAGWEVCGPTSQLRSLSCDRIFFAGSD